jgi:hypothetical protein
MLRYGIALTLALRTWANFLSTMFSADSVLEGSRNLPNPAFLRVYSPVLFAIARKDK